MPEVNGTVGTAHDGRREGSKPHVWCFQGAIGHYDCVVSFVDKLVCFYHIVSSTTLLHLVLHAQRGKY